MSHIDVESLRLRPVELADAPRIHEWASRPEASTYQPWGPNNEGETRAFVEEATSAWSGRPQTRWVWVAVDAGQQISGLGEVGLRGAGRAEISYAVDVDLWGRGIGSAIARLLTSWAFDELGVERVEATCDPRNAGSEGVLRRIGMTYEGTLRHTLRLEKGWRDSKVFSVLRQAWVT